MKKVHKAMAEAMVEAFQVNLEEAWRAVESFPVDLERDEQVVPHFKQLCETQEPFLGHRIKQVITAPKKLTRWKLQGEKRERKMRIKTFLKEYPQGTFFIVVRSHALTISDSRVWDPSPKGITEKYVVKYALLLEKL
jgi:hypothetical protein